MSDMFEKVREIMVNTLSCNLEDVTMQAKLQEDLGIDSLDAVELNIAIEEELGIAVPDEEFAEVQTVADIVRALEAQA